MQEPQDAASLVIYERSADDLRILMGQRGAATQFMPNRYVFPGGRVDPDDASVGAADSPLRSAEVEKLLLRVPGRVEPARAHALAIAAVRETFEEAGLVFGSGIPDHAAAISPQDKWSSFARHANAPALSELTYFARAITPPGQKRRYDTRFFCVARTSAMAETGETDGELSNLAWYPLRELEALNLAPITQAILGEFKDAFVGGALDKGCPTVPFYYQDDGIFRRDILSAAQV